MIHAASGEDVPVTEYFVNRYQMEHGDRVEAMRAGIFPSGDAEFLAIRKTGRKLRSQMSTTQAGPRIKIQPA